MKKMYGINTPIPCPMTEEQKIDAGSLERLCNYLIEKGIHGLYVNGSTGEMCYLTKEERKQMAELSVKFAAGRTQVFSMVGSLTTEDTIELAQHAEKCGCDGIGVVTPFYLGLTDDELFSHFKTVAESVSPDFPVYLYGIPHCAVNDISVSLAEQLAETCPNIVGLKYSEPDMPRLIEFTGIKNGNFSVLTGADDLYFAAFTCGAKGTISGNSNVIPEYYLAIYNAFLSMDYATARKMQAKINKMIKYISGPGCISRYKECLKHRGIISSAAVRAPMRPISREARKELIDYLEAMDYTNPSID